jgi:hypothetical protein
MKIDERSRRRRLGTVLLAVGLASTTCSLILGPSAVADTAGPVTQTKTVTRVDLQADGTDDTANEKHKSVTVSVSQTQGLLGRQNVDVKWSGAQPTGGVISDPNSSLAPTQEYPMVILECRGQEDASLPAAQQVSPQTCWTHGSAARFASDGTAFAPWTIDRYASAVDRAVVQGLPSDLPSGCGGGISQKWLPFIAADGTSYGYGPLGCDGMPPEDFNLDTSSQSVPPNATFAATQPDGTGAVKFDMWTAAENASLGCSATVQCTLEVIPIMGISCDPYGVSTDSGTLPADRIPTGSDLTTAQVDCEAGGNFPAGSGQGSGIFPSATVSGEFWWSASNWRNRMSFPLTFAPTSNACSATDGRTAISVYGSELMTEAMTQWTPSFCLDPKLFKITHVQTGEPLAQSLLGDSLSGVDAAFGSVPPPYPFQVSTVQAPIAATGFAVTFNIDDATRHAVTTLHLTPRLLAKLITESYLGRDMSHYCAACPNPYGAMSANPITIENDPEFIALNPGISRTDPVSAAAMIMLDSNSDVTYALTSYINADPEARAWLNGQPDPWGMLVNPNYKGISLPLYRWPLLDTTVPDFGGTIPCQTPDTPTPWLPLVASPTPTLATTAIDVEFASSPAKVACNALSTDASAGFQWAATGRQGPGIRFVIGVTSLAQANRYDLNVAALQSASFVPDASAKFTDGNGRIFVLPSQASLKAAMSQLTADPTKKLWTVNYAGLQSTPSAYPGIMPVYLDVPVTGLDSDLASKYATFLSFAAGTGQIRGTSFGQLPDGYLPLTKDNGAADLLAYDAVAAAAIRKQSGVIPPLMPAPAQSASSAHRLPTSSVPTAFVPPNSAPEAPVPVTSAPVVPVTPVSSGTSAAVSSEPTVPGPAATPAALSVTTPKVSLGASGVLLPLLLVVGLLVGVVGGGLLLVRPGSVGEGAARLRARLPRRDK